MKKLLTIAITMGLVLSYKSAYAQYIKLPLNPNHYWKHFWSYTEPFPQDVFYTCNFQYAPEKDSLIGGIVYSKVKINALIVGFNVGALPYSSYFTSPYTVLLRQDTVAKIVVARLNSGQEKILYNFNKNVGDTASLYDYLINSTTVFTVTVKDSILLNDGIYHKRLTVASNSQAGGVVIEGVGGIKSLTGPYYQKPLESLSLQCFGKDYPTQQSIYPAGSNIPTCEMITAIFKNSLIQNSIEINFYPNPSNGLLNIQVSTATLNNYNLKLINVLGQEERMDDLVKQNDIITLNIQQLKKGIYFLKILENNNLMRTTKIIKE
jgi:hypothetical protein